MINCYVGLRSNPDSLRGSLGFYPFDATLAQSAERRPKRLTMPVLGLGGEKSYGDHVADAMKPLANDVQTAVIPGAGHWAAEEAPNQLLAALTVFLAPYRDGAVRRKPAAPAVR